MASSVFFRFKSQKEPSRVVFDGTGISVFELKREIITQSNLGDGSNFELVISSEETNEEYDDDTSIIPRSTTVIAKRMPAARAGRGGAARYVLGKMPQSAKHSHIQELPHRNGAIESTKASTSAADDIQNEDQKIAQMLQLGANDWAQQQQHMASAVPVSRAGPPKGKPHAASDRPLPQAYVCNRCGEKGHWIWDCPTNNDPTFDGKPRIKRTTGIPRSFLKTIEKPAPLQSDGTSEDKKQPAGVMVNSEGEWVVAEPDQATWDRYQAQNKSSMAAQNAAAEGNKELRDLGLECKLDKRLFVDPTKTPCCGTTFCHECIQNALLDNDLRCPQCSTDNVPIDDLTLDTETAEKVHLYSQSRTIADHEVQDYQTRVSPPKQLTVEETRIASLSPSQNKLTQPAITAFLLSTSKKRPADSELANERRPPGPEEPITQYQTSNSNKDSTSEGPHTSKTTPRSSDPSSFATAAANKPTSMNNVNSMNGASNLLGMNMDMSLPNPSMLPMGPFPGTPWMNMWPMAVQPQGVDMSGNPFGHVSSQTPFNFNNQSRPPNLPGTSFNGPQQTKFANQQRSANDEESAYFRKPVNPNRQNLRRNWNQSRPADYREV